MSNKDQKQSASVPKNADMTETQSVQAEEQGFNPFAPVNLQDEQGFTYAPGMFRRYSTHRKDGVIQKRSSGAAHTLGTSLDMVILTATNVFNACMFQQRDQITNQPRFDNWIALGFVDTSNTASVLLLNSGTTDALRPFLEYQMDLASEGLSLGEVVTTLGFKPFKSGRGYTYSFQYRNSKKEDREWITKIQDWYWQRMPVIIEPTLPADVLDNYLKVNRYSDAQIAEFQGARTTAMQTVVDSETGEISQVPF